MNEDCVFSSVTAVKGWAGRAASLDISSEADYKEAVKADCLRLKVRPWFANDFFFFFLKTGFILNVTSQR